MTTLNPSAAAPKYRARGGLLDGQVRPHVIGAVFNRNFQAYFANPAGYVFITLFVLVGAYAAFWRPEFFANNLANLAPLNQWMPYLLLFFIPAITMSAWAEERRQGTDELLLTLPARDIEVVLGKYLAALGIYTVALAFSLTHVLVLLYLGHPDLGIMFANFVGYWLMGALMIAVGLVASLVSTNVTVGFILGAVFNAIPVALGLIGVVFPSAIRRGVEDLSVPEQFRNFGEGVIAWDNVFYFVSLAAAMLYLNMVLLGRRHWAGGERSRGLAGHSLARVAALIVALIGLNVLIARTGLRADVSVERISTLGADSRRAISEITDDKPVYIQAYYSADVPREFVAVKATLLSKLREYAALGGDKIRLNLIETDLFSVEARDAQKRFGIEPKTVTAVEEARQSASQIFLGVAFTSGLEEVVIPFFDPGTPVEYEITRSLRVASKTGRKKVGVLGTDAKLMGGIDFRSMGQDSEWPFVQELKKQYEVSSVAADGPIPADLDVLLVAQPSSLNQKQVDTLADHIRAGHPTLIFHDPLPIHNPSLAPEVPKQPPGGPFGGGAPPEPKADIRPILDLLWIEAPGNEVVWNTYNPLAGIPDIPYEYVFVAPGSGGDEAFNPKEPAASGLQQVVMMYGGYIKAKVGGPEVTPLLRVGGVGGTVRFADLVQQSFMGITGLNPSPRHLPTNDEYTLAARIQGKPAATGPDPLPDPTADPKAKPATPPKVAEIRAIVIADLDLIHEQFFQLRRLKSDTLDFDNIAFVLNCVDVLAGDETYINLRKRRPIHRTLTRLEQQTRNYVEQAQKEAKQADDEAEDALRAAQTSLDAKVAGIRNNKEIDDRTREVQTDALQRVEQRRFDVTKATIEDQKRRKVQDSKATKEQGIHDIQSRVRVAALAAAPLPPLFLAGLIFGIRARRENRGANPKRLAS